MATDHLAACTGEAPAFRIGTCDHQRAEMLSAMDCHQLGSIESAARANGWWDDFLCELDFTDHCSMTSRPDLHTLVGTIHKLDDTPAVAVYVRVIRDRDPSDQRGSWTFEGGVFAIRDLEETSYRLEVALAPTTATLFAHELGGESYLALQAPIP